MRYLKFGAQYKKTDTDILDYGGKRAKTTKNHVALQDSLNSAVCEKNRDRFNLLMPVRLTQEDWTSLFLGKGVAIAYIMKCKQAFYWCALSPKS